MKNHEIIKKPLLTEKSYLDISNKKYTFVVAKDASKSQIKKAVEEMFEVKVEKVNTANVRPKVKKQQRKEGPAVGKTAAYKKAYVKLTEESKSIEFFDSLS